MKHGRHRPQPGTGRPAERGVLVWDRTSSADLLVGSVRTFGGDCIALAEPDRLGGGGVTATFTQLPGLREGATGYALVLADATGAVERAARAYVAVDRRVVVVGARAPAGSPLPDLTALLDLAVQRVEAQGEPA